MYPILPRLPTPQEYAVLAIFGAVAFFVAGGVAFVLAWRLPVEKHEAMLLLVRVGVGCLAVSAIILLGFWVYRQLVD